MQEPETLIDLIASINSSPEPPKRQKSARPSSADDEALRAKQIKNYNAISDQKMKEKALTWLFFILFGEVFSVITLAFLQGFGGGDHGWFHIEEWCFSALVTSVIAQTIIMVSIAVKHLFPNKDK